HHSIFKESPKCISALDAVGANAVLGPAAIINSMIRLNGSNHSQTGIADKVLGSQMLRMLNSPAAVVFAVALFNLLKHIQRHGDCPVPYGVNAELQSSRIRAFESLQHG